MSLGIRPAVAAAAPARARGSFRPRASGCGFGSRPRPSCSCSRAGSSRARSGSAAPRPRSCGRWRSWQARSRSRSRSTPRSTLTLALVLAAGAVALPFAWRQRSKRQTATCVGRGIGRARRRRPRCAPVGDRGSRPRRRALPSRPHPQARRLRLAVAARGRRVQGRRAAPRLRVPALARLARPCRRARARRPDEGRPPRAEHPRAARARARVRDGRRPSSARRGWGSRRSLAQVAMIAFAPGAGGAYTSLELPGTVARQLLVPAAIALFFRFVRAPSRLLALTLAAAGMDLAFVHPTYALFVAIPLVGFGLARLAIARADVRASAAALAAYGIPVLLVFAWLEPIVAETQLAQPRAGREGEPAPSLRGGPRRQLAELVPPRAGVLRAQRRDRDRGARARAARGPRGAAALERARPRRRRARARARAVVARLPALLRSRLAVPVPTGGGFRPVRIRARRRRGRARAAARGCSCSRRRSRAGIVLQLVYGTSAPARRRLAWIALFGGLAALVLAIWRRHGGLERPGPVAALAVSLFALPVIVHGFSQLARTAGDPIRRRSRPGSSAISATTCRSGRSSSPTSRRATASPRTRRSTSVLRRPRTWPTRRRTIPPRGART